MADLSVQPVEREAFLFVHHINVVQYRRPFAPLSFAPVQGGKNRAFQFGIDKQGFGKKGLYVAAVYGY